MSTEAPDKVMSQDPARKPDPAHNSRNSLDWAGVCTGTIPCADCPGIEMSITLLQDGTYQRAVKYLDRDERPRFDQGQFAWNDAGAVITSLMGGQQVQRYRVGEGVLLHLDAAGKAISGELAANCHHSMMPSDPGLQGQEWVLYALMGQPVNVERPPTLRFDRVTGRLSGSEGCNRFTGSYRLREMNRLQIAENLASTMMACAKMDTPERFIDALQRVDSYSIANGELSLQRARMAPALRFRLAEANH